MQTTEFLSYIFLGILQGITEPIPVSSSGHLVIAREIFNIEARGLSFEIFLNTASLIAIVFVYRKDIITIFLNVMRFLFKGARDKQATTDMKYTILLIIATIPVGVLGLLLKDVIGENVSVGFVGLMLLVTGIALWIIKNQRGKKRDGQLNLKDAIIVGAAQCVALVPGISRSGATLVGAIGVGLNQKDALRFVFLLYIPVSLGTAIISVEDILYDPILETHGIAYLASFIICIIATYFGVKWLQNIMQSGNLVYFSYYCFVLGTGAIAYGLFI